MPKKRDINNKPVYRMDKDNPEKLKVYVVNPVATVYADDKYYMICYDDRHGNLVQYRVDRMDQTKMIQDDITPSKEATTQEIIKYRRSLVGMFGGREETVEFEADESVVESIFDKFGHNVAIQRVENGKVRFKVTVQISKPFLTWVVGFGKQLKVKAPSSVVEDIKALLREAVDNYGVE